MPKSKKKTIPSEEQEEALVIGSRGSDLALWQANFILNELKKIKISAKIKIIKTQGDKIQDLSFDKLEGKGFFTKEIEDALLNNEIDLAIHSHKDLPTESPKGLMIAAVSEREDPSELLLIHKSAVDEKEKFSLKQNARVGTSSVRRKSQMLAWRNDIRLDDLRGNVPTRIQKLREKKYDAILIANAGILRLNINLDEFHCEKLSPKEFMPAPAQGVLALQIRTSDKELFQKLQKLNHPDVAETISVERKVLNLFDGGCQLPLGIFCEKGENENLASKKISVYTYRVWVSKAENAVTPPKYLYFESKKTEGLAEKITQKINSVQPCSVFISRDIRKHDFFRDCLTANQYKVFAQSLIEIKQVPIRKYKKCDWIFFSSKNAVKHFFEQTPDVEGMKLGAVGKITADEIRKYGKRAEFIGSADNTRMTGKKFSALVGNKTVLFPQAKESMKTIQLQLPKRENVIDLIVYETIKIPSIRYQVSSIDIFVFTSPSNVQAYFEKNTINANQKVVVMGNATANALKNYNIKANKQATSFDDLGLVQAVMGI